MKPDPIMLARRIQTLIQRNRIPISTETAAHQGIFDLLMDNGLVVQSEIRLSDADRIDMIVENVGIEVKIGGQKRQILAQLNRYAAHESIAALVLASSISWRGTIAPLRSTPVFMASLTKGWL